jgi:hypothetical protein
MSLISSVKGRLQTSKSSLPERMKCAMAAVGGIWWTVLWLGAERADEQGGYLLEVGAARWIVGQLGEVWPER